MSKAPSQLQAPGCLYYIFAENPKRGACIWGVLVFGRGVYMESFIQYVSWTGMYQANPVTSGMEEERC